MKSWLGKLVLIQLDPISSHSQCRLSEHGRTSESMIM